MTVHKTTGVTPNMAMFGRKVLLPATLIARPPEEATKISGPFVVDFRDTLRTAHQKVCENTKKTARTQKNYYDQRTRPFHYEVGQQVWLYWPRPPIRQKFKKLQSLWTGPWTIEAFQTPLVVILRHPSQRGRQTVHVDRLLPCHSQPAQATNAALIPESSQVEPEASAPILEPSALVPDSSQSTYPFSSLRRSVRTRRSPAAIEPYILD